MNLVSTDLKFGELICRRITRRIVIHHSASPDVPAAEIHRWHLQRRLERYRLSLRYTGRTALLKRGAH